MILSIQAGYLIKTECSTYPARVTQAYLLYILSLLGLFLNFYFSAYAPKPNSVVDAKGKGKKNK
jgi:hypothetical protein